MKTTLIPRLLTTSIAALVMAALPTAQAANQVWTGSNATSGNWSTGTNWNGGAAPLAANTATFNATISNTWGNSALNPIVLTADTSIKSFSFTGATGSYFIGSTSGPKFILTSGGSLSITNNTTLTASNATITINAPM